MLTDMMCDEEYAKLESLVAEAELSSFTKEYFDVNIAGHKLSADAYICDNELRLFTVSRFRIKHKFELYLTALLAFADKGVEYAVSYYYFDKDKDKDKVMSFELPNIDYANAKNLLKHYVQQAREFSTKPMLAHLSLAEAIMADGEAYGKKYQRSEKQKQEAWEKVISDENNPVTLDKDEYFNVFYPQSPSSNELVSGVYDEFFDVVNCG